MITNYPLSLKLKERHSAWIFSNIFNLQMNDALADIFRNENVGKSFDFLFIHGFTQILFRLGSVISTERKIT